MAEIEYKGIKIGGSKLLLVLPLLGTIMGGLWGGFELFSRYQAMEAKIDQYVAPDLSGFDKRLAVIEEEITFMKEELDLVSGVAKDLKNDMKGDIRRIETIVEDTESKVKEDSRELNRDINSAIKDLKEDMTDLEEKVEKQIKKALENPLSNMATSN